MKIKCYPYGPFQGLPRGSNIAALFHHRIAAMYLLCGGAFVIYLLKVPECLFPGMVDIFGHSHQWWHLIMLVAFVHWQHSGILMAKFRLEHGCQVLPAGHEALEEITMWPF